MKEHTWIWRKIDEGVNWVTFALEPIVIKYVKGKK